MPEFLLCFSYQGRGTPIVNHVMVAPPNGNEIKETKAMLESSSSHENLFSSNFRICIIFFHAFDID